MLRGARSRGQLELGALAPGGAALARETGYSSVTCSPGLKTLIPVPMTREP